MQEEAQGVQVYKTPSTPTPFSPSHTGVCRHSSMKDVKTTAQAAEGQTAGMAQDTYQSRFGSATFSSTSVDSGAPKIE